MQNLTKNIENLERSSFACGGFADLHKAFLYTDNSSKRCKVAVKFPNVWEIESKVGDEKDAVRAKILQRQKREIAAGQSMSHPNVVPFLGFCDNSDSEYKEFVGIVLPLCENGNASSYIQRNPNVDRLSLLLPAAAALYAMHTNSPPVIHGDLKAANILINDHGEPLLADFGLSRVCAMKGFTTKNISGSTRWMAVELLRASATSSETIAKDHEPVRTTQASDVWAFAMTILEILTGKPPFSEYTFEAGIVVALLMDNLRPSRPTKSHINDALWVLLESCWADEPNARPGMRQVGLALDIIYGFGPRKIDSTIVLNILSGAFDNSAQPFKKLAGNSASMPYCCKWLHCHQAFNRIEDCVAHECAEFTQRCVTINLCS